MSLLEAIEALILGLAGIAGIIEKLPGKLKPWTWLIRALGGALNHGINAKVDDINKKVDGLATDVDSLKNEMQERDAINARVRILRFGDECRVGVKHSKDYFDQIENDITLYENYCSKHDGFKNNITAITIEIINEVYAKCLKNDDFI